jgi:CheY-like chemotaxis protein
MSPSTARRRVLVAASSADEAASLDALLAVWGCETRFATDAATTVAAAEAFQPSHALIDLRMDGADIAGRLRAIPGLDAVTLIAVARQDVKGKDAADEFDHRLSLPVDPETLRRIVLG